MAEETANDTAVAQENEVAPNEEAVQGDELVQGEELAQADEVVQGEELAQDDELAQGDDLVEGHELVVVEETTPRTGTRRGRRKKSLVWEHFTIEEVAGGVTRACCNLCKQTFAYSSGSKIAGTSHLKRHITLGSCPKIKNQEQRLALPSGGVTDNDGEGTVERPTKRRYRYTGYANAAFDQERSCSYLAKMIIQHDYPLHIVQQPAFATFIESLQPRFKIVDIDTMEAEVYAVYQKEKENLMQTINTMPGRISLTIGLWTTSQTLGYVSLAGQFIDSEWKAWKLQLELTNGTGHEDPTFSSIAKDMHERFDKYWKDCSLVLAIAVVMDPRFKMKLVEFSYSKIYGAEAAKYVKVVDDAVHELYKEYVAQPLPLTPAYVDQE
nr:unnamed protein product [Digitaria exilis]